MPCFFLQMETYKTVSIDKTGTLGEHIKLYYDYENATLWKQEFDGKKKMHNLCTKYVSSI